jgi:uncharacterized protein YcnI
MTVPALTLAFVWGAVVAPPAGAHAVFQGVRSVPADVDAPLTMFVPHERDEATYNVKVIVAVASGWRAVACVPKPTWACSIGTAGGSEAITYAKDAGAARAEDETFEFTLHSPGPGDTASFPTRQVYSDAEAVDWSGPPGSPEPAPLLRTLEAGRTAAPAETTTSTTTPTPEPTASSASIDTASAEARATGSPFVLVGGLVSVVVVLAVAATRRRRREP